jgi:hypothetical protein
LTSNIPRDKSYMVGILLYRIILSFPFVFGLALDTLNPNKSGNLFRFLLRSLYVPQFMYFSLSNIKSSRFQVPLQCKEFSPILLMN